MFHPEVISGRSKMFNFTKSSLKVLDNNTCHMVTLSFDVSLKQLHMQAIFMLHIPNNALDISHRVARGETFGNTANS